LTSPLLSVTVLNYNYARFLPGCLDSILRQSFEDFELIIIDDRSTDDSLEVIRPYLSDPRVRLVAHEQNQGFVRSLVEGTNASRSRYLTVISADDFVLADDAFERQVRLLESDSDMAFCYAAWRYVDAEWKTLSEVRPWAIDHSWSGEQEFREFCTRYYVLHTGTIIRRSAYDAVGGYDQSIRYTLDNTIWAQLCGAGSVGYVSETLYGYRTHGANMSHNPAAVRATVDEFARLVDLGFAGLPDSPTKHDRKLRRRARQAALAGVPTMLVFAGLRRAGWSALLYAARTSPFEVVVQRRTLALAIRTIVGDRVLETIRALVRSFRDRRGEAHPARGPVRDVGTTLR
jgi:glycosyltransferase involved in cell wall biosynthesis